ncbi:MAG TPA: CotH kinase family protein [Polyangiaceae bacterium]|nr:CotH kinase family protein [Polyangiaceae bacterium]
MTASSPATTSAELGQPGHPEPSAVNSEPASGAISPQIAGSVTEPAIAQPPTVAAGGAANPSMTGALPDLGGGGGPMLEGPSLDGAGGAPELAPIDGSASAMPDAAASINFSVPSQSFQGELMVELSTSVGGADIHYTTDGSPPTADGMVYAGGPIAIDATTQLRAQPFTDGVPAGSVQTAIYIARTFDATSTLPILLLDGYGGGESTDKDLYLNAAIMVFEPVDGTASLSNLPTLVTRAGYHLRGQSSATFEQHPYRLEFRDEADEDANYPLLGMPADSDWALIAPFYDRTLLRNPFTYTLGKDLGLQAPRTAFSEVYVNYEARPIAEDDYQGIYWVTETIKNNSVRTNLQQLKDKDTELPTITGGYMMSLEQYAAEEPTIPCTGSDPIGGGFGAPGGGGLGGGGLGTSAPAAPAAGTCWQSLELIDPGSANTQQLDWITQYIQDFHDTLNATPMGDYAAYIDVPSFVDYFLLTELTRNMDAYVRSAHYFKDRDGKLQAGPLWDYNFAYGEGSSDSVDPMGGWQLDAGRNVNGWYQALLTDDTFKSDIKARWQVLRQDLFSTAAFDERITTLSAELGTDALAKDSLKWPISFMIERAGRSMVPITFPTDDTYESQLQALRDFLAARLGRMDELVEVL